ncbi:MAG: ribonuclease III [Chloroflexi bacterium]|nr:ribonuclease III [Chloroflexota bacterium]
MINHSTPSNHSLSELQDKLGIKFNCIELLAQAMRHPSILNEEPRSRLGSYERLEFLGDSFLGWVVAQETYKRYPNFPEGQLTKARALLVRGSNLQSLAQALNLGKYMELGQGEVASGGRNRPSNLAAVFESLVGAILLDRGEKTAAKFILHLLDDQIKLIASNKSLNDPKSALQEFLQKKGLPLPVYQVVNAKQVSRSKLFVIQILIANKFVAEGIAPKKSTAEQQAAESALAILRDQNSELQ